MNGRINADAPLFESREETREPSLQCDSSFLIELLNIDEIEDVAKRINGAGGFEVVVDMGDHLKPFAIKSTFLNEQVRNGELTVSRTQ